jgi:exoribonuclease R
MLPEELNNGITSLSKKNTRYSLSLTFIMNKDGIVDFRTVEYQQKTIEVVYNLSYEQAENLILNKKPNDLENKVSKLTQ